MLEYDCLKCDNCQLCQPLAKTLGKKFRCPTTNCSSTVATASPTASSTAVREEPPGPETRPTTVAERKRKRPSKWNIFVGVIRKDKGASARFKDIAGMYAFWTKNGRFPDSIKDLEAVYADAVRATLMVEKEKGANLPTACAPPTTRIGYKKRLAMLPPEGVPFTMNGLPGRRSPWDWFLYKAIKKGDVNRFGKDRFVRISKTGTTAPKGAKTKKRLGFNDRTAMLPEEFKTKDLPGPFIARRCFLYRAKRQGLVEMIGCPCGVNTKWKRIHAVLPVPPAEKSAKTENASAKPPRSYLQYNDCLAMLPAGDFGKKDLPHPPKNWDFFLNRAYKKGDVERIGRQGSRNMKWRRTSPSAPKTVPIDYFRPPEEPGVEPPQTAAASPDKPGEKAPLQKRTRKSSAPRAPNPRISIPDLGKSATYAQRLAAISTEWFTDADLPGGIKRWYPFLYKARNRGDAECQHRKWRKIPPPAAPIGRPRGRKNTSPKERYNTLPDGLFSLKDLPGDKKTWLSYINRVVKLGLVLKHIDGRHIRYERVVKKPDIPLGSRVEDSANGRMMEELRKSDPTN